MRFKSLCAFVFALLIYSLPSRAEFDEYTYTLTSPTFTSFTNDFSPVWAEYHLINANDFVRLAIHANVLLNSVDSPLIFGRLMFNAGEIYQLALTDRDEFFRGSYINSDLNIYDVNELGVPLSWSFNYGHTTPLNETGSSYSSFNYFLSNTESTFSLLYIDPLGERLAINGQAPGGSWTFVDNVSPVPENETYAMLIIGLGLLGFIGRRNKQFTKVSMEFTSFNKPKLT